MRAYTLFYLAKPLLPRWLQLNIRSLVIRGRRSGFRDVWPIDPRSSRRPPQWTGWPEKKRFALVLTHDVETKKGLKSCPELLEMESALGFRSSFNFVPKRYELSRRLRRHIVDNGFEVGVHGLYHDGRLFQNKRIFLERAAEINGYLKKWHAVGFRSPSMHHRMEWIHRLGIHYDASTFDTDPFEPQSDGVGTIFPIWVPGDGDETGYVELPYTLPQDFTLFVLMKERDIAIWKKKVDWIAKHGGMALLNTHPDYMAFDSRAGKEEYPADYYLEFLHYLKARYEGRYWHILPRQMADYWDGIRSNPSKGELEKR